MAWLAANNGLYATACLRKKNLCRPCLHDGLRFVCALAPDLPSKLGGPWRPFADARNI